MTVHAPTPGRTHRPVESRYADRHRHAISRATRSLARDTLRTITTVAHAATTPLLPDDYLELVDPLAGGPLRAQVSAVRPETSDAVTIVLRPGRGWQGHTPGQYLRIGVDIDGVRLWRAYSITSPSTTAAFSQRSIRSGSVSGTVSITVKAIPDGVVSNHLVRHLQPGAIVSLEQAAGDFTLPAQPPAKALFVTGGSGITPVMGMLRHHLADLDDVVVVHSAPTPADVIFAAELRAWDRSGQLRLIEQHTNEDGLLSTQQLRQLVPDIDQRETWACGPAGMTDALADLFESNGWADRLHIERFRPALGAVGDGGTIEFAKTGTRVAAAGDTTLLAAGEDAGVLMPSGCRMGICFGCVLPLQDGSVKDLRTGDVTTASPGDGVLVQTCISAAAGPCTLAG